MIQSWQTKQDLTDLLCSLVGYPSITGSEAELALPEYLYALLLEKEYFQAHPNYVNLHPLKDGRQLLTALVKQSDQRDTVILLSHFDVVSVEDYGSFRNLAFDPKKLTKQLLKQKDKLPKQVQADLEAGEWLFGRGAMDMKAGLAIHLSMIEKAIAGDFDGNILLVSVPDEEVNSLGMLTALPALQQIKQQQKLNYKLCINGEPVFSKYPGDPGYYVYTGSIGKVLPGFFCYGKETHVGEPFAGLNANLMNSFISQQLELNEAFVEKAGEEVTPPPVSLMQRDLKEEYSVQTPVSAVAMYNVLYLKQSIETINQKLYNAAVKASEAIQDHFLKKANYYSEIAGDFSVPSYQIGVYMYEELYQLAASRYGIDEVKRRQNRLSSKRDHDKGDRDFSTILVQDLASMCKDLAPMIVLFYSPPFYPAVSSKQDALVRNLVEHTQAFAKSRFLVDLEEVEFFPGLSDLSFIGPVSSQSSLTPLLSNLPIQNNGYQLDEAVMEALKMPIINLGPFGKDPHQWTERLELSYSFDQLPHILANTIQACFQEGK
ncbi:M20/M25/M40 family metallo-hydrolase [Radiobacillus sp. PE A8.2]|uniref:M20/M25/M40 family metallo-hydrolase n=1 Tax=Radiobacillus sp. PE A8.2 TaxID=3380349 RepID=UPI00388D58E6